MKTKLIYTNLPIDQIHYLDRPEFHKEEKEFKNKLTASIKKHGILEPVYAEYGHHYGPKIKIIVGNNRMAVAKELGIKTIPAVITNFKADTLPIEGRVLNKDAEIRELFHLPKDLQIKRDVNGDVKQVMPIYYMKEGVREEYV